MTRGERVIAFIERYLHVPGGKGTGKRIKLLPFQRKFILEFYDNPAGTSVGILSMARKGGKTALIAALVITHVIGPEAVQNSQIISGANSKEQAGMIFKYAWDMLKLSPELKGLWHAVPASKILRGLPMNVEYKAISAEASTAHGLSPIMGILDEMGQIRGPQSAFVDAIVTAQGAYSDARLIYISTQAEKDSDLLSVLIDDALKGEDPKVICHLYAADAECDILDELQWRKANPGLGIINDLDNFKQNAAKADRLPSFENTFRNLMLNQRVSTFSPLINGKAWKSVQGDTNIDGALTADGKASIYCGLDLSYKLDLTAFAMCQRVGDKVHAEVLFFAPEDNLLDRVKKDKQPYDVWARDGYLHLCPGATVSYEWVIEVIHNHLQNREIALINFDRWRMDVFMESMARMGIAFPMANFGQGHVSMSPAIDALEEHLLNQTIVIQPNPVLTMCAANAGVKKLPGGVRKFEKSEGRGRDDGIVALAMALRGLVANTEAIKPKDGEIDFGPVLTGTRLF